MLGQARENRKEKGSENYTNTRAVIVFGLVPGAAWLGCSEPVVLLPR